MSHFTFKAKRPNGEVYKGERDASDRYELYKIIREGNDELISYHEKSAHRGLNVELSFGTSFKRVKTVEKINFARNLGSMLDAGLPLSRALSVLERQSKNKAMKSIISSITENINRGNTLSDALKEHSKVFPPLFVSMVHAGEQSGTLAGSLKTIAIQMEKVYTLERRIKGALIYPAVIVSAMILIAILMFIFVIPTLLKTFTELKVELPFTTRMILGASEIIRHQGHFLVLALIVIFGGIYLWSKRKEGKRIIHSLLLQIPVIGILVQEVNTARTARTLSSLLDSGVDVVEAVSITSDVVQNVHFKDVLVKACDAIKKGDQMSKIFENYPKLYPAFFSEMMSVGEETGKMGEMLAGVGRYYEDDVEQKTKDMSTIIEPILMIVIGAAVGFFAVSMISPMYSLVDAIK